MLSSYTGNTVVSKDGRTAILSEVKGSYWFNTTWKRENKHMIANLSFVGRVELILNPWRRLAYEMWLKNNVDYNMPDDGSPI